MYYINSRPDSRGNYGNPRTTVFDGATKLPDGMIDGYLASMGFVSLAVVDGTVTKLSRNNDAYGEYIHEQSSQRDDPEERIAELKRNLAETDYIACKIAEGAATREEYADIIVQRQLCREEINELQKELINNGTCPHYTRGEVSCKDRRAKRDNA